MFSGMVRKDWHAHSACVSLQSSRGRRVLCQVASQRGESKEPPRENKCGRAQGTTTPLPRRFTDVFGAKPKPERQEATAHPSRHAGVKLPYDTPLGCRYFASVNINPSIRTRKKKTRREIAQEACCPKVSPPNHARCARSSATHPLLACEKKQHGNGALEWIKL